MNKSKSNSWHPRIASLSSCPQTVDRDFESGELPELALEIRKRLNDSTLLLSQGIQNAWEAGKMLLEAKKLCRHGEWISWLKENVKLSKRQAQRYMRLVKKYPDFSKATRASLLTSIRKALTVEKPQDENEDEQGNEDRREEEQDDEEQDDEEQDDEEEDDEEQDDEEQDDEEQDDEEQDDEEQDDEEQDDEDGDDDDQDGDEGEGNQEESEEAQNDPDLHRKRCTRLRRLTGGKRLSEADKQLLRVVDDAIGNLIPKLIKLAQGGAAKLIKRRDADDTTDQTLIAMLIVAQLRARLNPESAFAPVVVDAD